MQKGRKNTVPRRSFTQKEQETLRENAYTEKVTEYQVCFTAEFKMAFWEAYCSGMKPTEIVRSLGYDPEILVVLATSSSVVNHAASGMPVYVHL